MFSYYGSKSKLAKLYPAPLHDVVVEPFAGSARYSLLHWEREVFLFDLSEVVVSIWKYLLEATEREIRSLPDVPSKVHLDEFRSLSQVEKALVGLHLCRGKAKPRKVGHGQNSWNRDKHRIADNLHKIKHWKVQQADYLSIRNRRATWFIDPPYQRSNTSENGDRYPHSVINFDDLARWTNSRRGQVIACEGEEANYLPFQTLATVTANTNNHGAKRRLEMVYTRSN